MYPNLSYLDGNVFSVPMFPIYSGMTLLQRKGCRLRQDRSGSTWLGLQSCRAPSCHPGPQWKPRKENEFNPQNHACDMPKLDYECLQTPKRWILICSKLILTSQQQFF